jgi:Phosphatidylinositol-specific phospholipase C, X domain
MGRSSSRGGAPPISGRTAATSGSASTYRSRTSAAGSAASSRARQEPKSGKCCCCCSLPVCVVIFLILGAVGGVLVWKFLPESRKSAVAQIGQNATPNDGSDGGTASTFKWNELCNGTTTDCCNGVPGLCGQKANDILFAGVHNAHATVDNGWVFAGNNEHSLDKALLAGYRGINVDVGMCDGQLKMIHGYCRLGMIDPAEAWNNITTFLQNNPNEVIVVTIEIVSQEDEGTVTLDALAATMPQDFMNLLYTDNPTTDFPTLQELIDLGQRILLFHYSGQSCSQVTCPPGLHEWFYYGAETKFENENVDAVTCPVERGANGMQYFYVINDFVTDPLPSRTAAETLNSKAFLENLIDSCGSIESRDVNLVFIDFWEVGDLVEVTQRHNLNLVQQSSVGTRQLLPSTPSRQEGSVRLRSPRN